LDRAIDACLAVKNSLNDLPEIAGEKEFKPKISIGIHSGEMVSGNIGSCTLRRLDYTVIGDTVNVAARLQSAADVGQILISEENYEKIKESFICKKLGKISMKNKKDDIMVYEVMS
jgi:class 3 adenylate cyclase